MNKEELKNYIVNINPWGLRASEFQKKILEAVNQLDEPQYEKGGLIPQHELMEVPEVIAEDIDYIRNELECDNAEIIRVITFENIGGTYDDETTAWVNQHNDDVISAVLYGCRPMKKRWVVKMKNAFFADFAKSCLGNERKKEWDLADFNTIVKGEVAKAYKFTDKAKAEAVATLVEGRVEEV